MEESEAYKLGWDAFNDYKSLEDNPYDGGSDKSDWIIGWCDAETTKIEEEGED